jgi:Transposase, Mutator family
MGGERCLELGDSLARSVRPAVPTLVSRSPIRERDVDLVREPARYLVQDLSRSKPPESMGATRYERSDERRTERNGHRERVLTTKAGDLEFSEASMDKGLPRNTDSAVTAELEPGH